MKISVIITTFNRPYLLKRAIKSVNEQSFKAHELIVIDDGSYEQNFELLEDKNIKYFYKKNGGISSARNLGIQKASYEWIAFLDDDDEWDKEKLALQAAYHKKHTNLLCSYTDEKWFKNGIEVKVAKRFRKPLKTSFKTALSHCYIAPSSIMIKKQIFEELGLFDEELEVCEDYDMWLRILDIHKIALVNKKLIIKHAHNKEQLGFKYRGMDRFRVQSLLKNLVNLNSIHQKQSLEILQKKLNILIKGAKKYENFDMLKMHEDILKSLF